MQIHLSFLDILHLAKVIALKKDDQEITQEHIKQALAYVAPADSFTEKIITENLIHTKIWPTEPEKTEISGEKLLEEYQEQPRLNLDQSVNEFFTNPIFKQNQLKFRWPTSTSVAPVGLFERIRGIRESLQAAVLDQNHAIDIITRGLVQHELEPNKTLPTSFLLVGPSGSGKSLTVEKLADKLTEEGWDFLTINMQSFQNEKEGFGLIGLRKGWGDAAPGKLTSFVHDHPRSVIVFDNFDGGHPNNLSLLAPLFTTGKLIDEHGFDSKESSTSAGEEVDFSQCLLFFITNSGEDVYERPEFVRRFSTASQSVDSTLIQHLSQLKSPYDSKLNAIPPSVANNLGKSKVAVFTELSIQTLISITRKQLSEQREHVCSKHNINISLPQDDTFYLLLVMAQAPQVNAAKLATSAIAQVNDPIVQYLLSSDDKIDHLEIRLEESARQFLDDCLSKDGDRLLERMQINNQTLTYSSQVSVDKASLVLEFHTPVITQIPAIEDYSGKGAIRIEAPATHFADIAGHNKVKKRLAETVQLLTSVAILKKYQTDQPRGMLLYGPPGTGKTMLAKALACEAGLPFIATTGPELLDLDYVRTLFRRARKYAPAIVFIDEIDIIGRRDNGGVSLIINQLLAELDGFDNKSDRPVFVIAATNYKDRIDPAILRPGRIDLHVEIPMLDRAARAYFLDKILTLPHEGDFNRDRILTFTSGMSGADLEKVRRECALELIHTGAEFLTEATLLEQINTIKYGARLDDSRLHNAVEATAYHEAGHAIVSLKLQPEIRIEQITVAPRANTLGFVSYDTDDGPYQATTMNSIHARVCTALAGRYAQAKQFPDTGVDSGASSDLAQATRLLWLAVAEWGLDAESPAISFSSLPEVSQQAMAPQINKRVKALLQQADAETKQLIDANWELLCALAHLLLQEEIVDSEELLQLVQTCKPLAQ